MIKRLTTMLEITEDDTMDSAATKRMVGGYIRAVVISTACVGVMAITLNVVSNKIDIIQEERLTDTDKQRIELKLRVVETIDRVKANQK